MTLTLTRRLIAATALSWLAAAAAGCVAAKSPMEPDSNSSDSSALAAAAAVCVDQVNQLRASVGDPPLARSSQIDTFSAEAARVDGAAHQAHKYFLDTNGGPGIA